MLVVEPGERIALSMRLRTKGGASLGDLQLAEGAPSFCKLQRETKGGGAILDCALQAPAQTTSYVIPLRLGGPAPEDLRVTINLDVPSNNFSITPSDLDLGEVSLKDLASGSLMVGRVGVRKQAGSFRITSVTSTLPFLVFEHQPIIEGSSYLVRVNLTNEKAPRPGSYTGVIRIETGEKPCEIPVKITIRGG